MAAISSFLLVLLMLLPVGIFAYFEDVHNAAPEEALTGFSSRPIPPVIHSALKVSNNLDRPLTMKNLPGCCSKCGKDGPPPGVKCIDVCVRCPDEVVLPGQKLKLDFHVGPFPIQELQILVQGEELSCLRGDGLTVMTASSTLAVGPGLCGPRKSDFRAFVFLADNSPEVLRTCLQDCAL